MGIKENKGGYLAPKVKIVNVSLKQTILEESYTGNSIEDSGENVEIGW